MARVRFWRDYGAIPVSVGTTLMAAAQRAAVPLGNACRSRGVCRACAVLVLSGAEHLDAPGPLELRFGLEPGWRMACQARVESPDPEAEICLWTPAWGGWPASDRGGEAC